MLHFKTRSGFRVGAGEIPAVGERGGGGGDNSTSAGEV